MIASGKASGDGGGTIVEQFYISGRIKSRSGDVNQHSADGTVFRARWGASWWQALTAGWQQFLLVVVVVVAVAERVGSASPWLYLALP